MALNFMWNENLWGTCIEVKGRKEKLCMSNSGEQHNGDGPKATNCKTVTRGRETRHHKQGERDSNRDTLKLWSLLRDALLYCLPVTFPLRSHSPPSLPTSPRPSLSPLFWGIKSHRSLLRLISSIACGEGGSGIDGSSADVTSISGSAANELWSPATSPTALALSTFITRRRWRRNEYPWLKMCAVGITGSSLLKNESSSATNFQQWLNSLKYRHASLVRTL